MNTLAADKRRYPRVDDMVCAWLSFKKDQAAYGTTTVNLGMEGARFNIGKPVQVGDHVLVCLQLPWMNIQCKGKVCWQEFETGGASGFGVRFLDLRDYERDFLTQYLGKTVYTDAAVDAEAEVGAVS